MKDSSVMGIVFSNMHDEFIHELTLSRTTASVPFGGKYRFIDFTLSNMINSNITHVGIIAKNNYRSLMDHVGSGKDWDLARKRGGLTILPPYSISDSGIYKGNIEALSGIMEYMDYSKAEYVVLSDCCVITNIDLQEVVKKHIDTGAQITVVYKEVEAEENSNDRVYLKIDKDNFAVDISSGENRKGYTKRYCNILVIKKSLLRTLVINFMRSEKYSIEEDILPTMCDGKSIYCFCQDSTVLDIRDIDSYMRANLSLLDKNVRADLFPADRPIYTKARDQVPTKFGIRSDVKNSLIGNGCIIEGTVRNSIIFRGVKIEKDAVVENSIIMQNTLVQSNAHLSYVISDKDVVFGNGRNICGHITYPIYIPKRKHI